MELTLASIRKVFHADDGEISFVLDLPELRFQLGSVNYILGHNGSGKTVFLKLLNGEFSPTDSVVEISLNGKKYTHQEINISIVRQKPEENLCMDLSVEENLLLRMSVNSLWGRIFPKKVLKDQLTRSLDDQHGLKKKIKQVCSSLSGGQKQALAFISATVQKSQILCLDEFLSSTDFRTSQMLRHKVKQYAKEYNACIIVVSHDFDVALEDADKIFIFDNGKLSCEVGKGSSKWNRPDIIKLVHRF